MLLRRHGAAAHRESSACRDRSAGTRAGVAWAALAISAAAGGAGCQSDASTCERDADEILVAATVNETDDEIVAAVRLYLLDPSGTTSSLRLCREQGDRLAFNGASMTESDVDQIFVYTSTLSSPAPDYRVEFVLGNETFSLTAQTPPAFEITLPVEGDSVSRSAAVDVTWAPANPGSALRLELLADDPTCVTSAILEPDDAGTFTVPPDTVTAANPDTADATCVATVRLQRRADGQVPPQLAEGSDFEAFVTRRRVVATVP